MTDFTTRFDRAPASYEPSAESYDQRMDAARGALIRGDRAGAEQALEAAITIAERQPDGGAPLAAALTRLGEIKHLDGKEAEAEQLFRRSLDINERLLGPEHPDLVVLLNDLSRLFLKRGAYADAEPLLLRLHAIKRTKGEDHPEVATVLASLASVHQALGRYDAAEQLWRRVLEIRERTLAPHHFSIATALEHLGETCAARGKLNEALRHRLRALAMREMTLDPGHPSLRTARERIADLQLQASEEVLDGDTPDAGRAAPVWVAPIAPLAVTPAPVTPAAQPPAQQPLAAPMFTSPAPASPPVVTSPPLTSPQAAPQPVPLPQMEAQGPVPRPGPTRPAPALPAFADDDFLDDDPGRRDLPESGGLHLVNVAGTGDVSRSVILPYYADALALADEAAADDLGGRQAGGFVSATVAFLRGRQAAIIASVGAGVLILGAIGAQTFAGSPGGDATLDEGRLRPAPASATLPAGPGAIADSATAAGTIDPAFDAADDVSARPSARPRVPDESSAPPSATRGASEGSRPAPAATAPAAGPAPRTLNVKIDPMIQPAGTGTREALAAKVTLPTGGQLRSIATPGEAESQPALLIASPTPVYPVSLYTKAVAGFAAVEFVVDTNGRVDLASFKSQSNDALFTEAVRRILPDMRFVASTRNGRKVRTPMKMRFEFSKSGVSSRPN